MNKITHFSITMDNRNNCIYAIIHRVNSYKVRDLTDSSAKRLTDCISYNANKIRYDFTALDKCFMTNYYYMKG